MIQDDIRQTMEKQQAKGIVLKHELKKQRVVSYPFYLVSATYSHEQDYHFLVLIDYSLETTVLTIYPFTREMNRLPASTISLNDVLTKKAVSALNVNLLRYKAHTHGVTILEAEFLLGHRSGHLALVQYKEKECKVMQRFNKALKGENFLSKTSSFFFGGEENYTTYFKEPIKSFQVHLAQPDLRYSYQIGNSIILMRDLNQSNEFAFFSQYEANNAQGYAFRYDLGTVAEKGSLSMFGTDDYYALKDSSRRVALLKFNHQVSSYAFLAAAKGEMAVALSMKQTILLIDTNKFILKSTIQTSMSIRRLSCFSHHKDDFMTIMVYDNYILLYNITKNQYCKLIGHRSFVADAKYDHQENMLISAGMDHRISLVKIENIKENSWRAPDIVNKTRLLDDQLCVSMRFPEIFSLGQYNNIRTNLHSYGYGDFLMLNNHYCMMTYDAKAVIYKYA